MATERRPIVLIGNTLHELPVGDYLPGLSNALTTDNSYTKEEVDLKLTNIAADAIDTNAVIAQLDIYSKADIDALLGLKANLDGVYTKNEVDTITATKASKADIYTRSQLYTKLETYKKTEVYSRLESYSKTEIDDLFSGFGAITENDVYTQTQIDDIINNLPLADNSVSVDTFTTGINDTKTWVQTYFLNKNDGVTQQTLDNANYLTKSTADTLYISSTDSYTASEVDNKLILKANAADVYSKSTIDNMIGGISSENFYLKEETLSRTQITTSYYDMANIDTKFGVVDNSIFSLSARVNTLETSGVGGTADVDLTDYYTKDTIDTKFTQYMTTLQLADTYASKTYSYSKAETDEKLSLKASVNDVYTKDQTYTQADLYTKTEVYSKTEIDDKMANIDESLDFSTIAVKDDITTALTTFEEGFDASSQIILSEIPLITVTNVDSKTFTGYELNPTFTQVYINRNILYGEEYEVSETGDLTILVDLVLNDKIKIFTMKKGV